MQAPPVTRQSSHRLAVVFLFCLFLLGQGAYSFVTEPEPYPTVRMPGFGSAPAADGLFPTTTASVEIHYEDGTTATPHVVDLMEGFRFSSARTSMDHVFRIDDGEIIDPAAKSWLHERATEIGGGRTPSTVEFCWQEAAIDIADASIVNAAPCERTEVKL